MDSIIYKIWSADKRSKGLKASSPAPAPGHHEPALPGVHIRGASVWLQTSASMEHRCLL